MSAPSMHKKPRVGILAGGYGSRLAEETDIRPKPMVEIGGMPILWHIMMLYHAHGHTDFSIALGYKGDYIKRWFLDHCASRGSFSLNTATGQRSELIDPVGEMAEQAMPDWDVSLVDTGLKAGTGGRIKQLMQRAPGERLMVTWGDGVADVDLDKLLDFHKAHGKLATMTAVRPPARYGHMEFEGNRILSFTEKPQTGEGWINGAFFVLEPQVVDYIGEKKEMFEQEPLTKLAADGELMAFHHEGFWQCMDTLREKQILVNLWEGGDAPWKKWS